MLSNTEILLMVLVVLGVFLAVNISVIGIIFWYAAQKARARKEIVESQVLRHAQDCDYVAVRYSSEKRFQKLCKLFPWEGAGVLVKSKDGVVFYGRSVLGNQEWRIEFAGMNEFQFLGRDAWRNGFLSWIMAKANDGTLHYFSSETGTLIFGSKVGTAKLLLQLQ